ncbi:MAG: peptidyl-prolyl cis-trans isomerase [Sumerlaeia bacterium]
MPSAAPAALPHLPNQWDRREFARIGYTAFQRLDPITGYQVGLNDEGDILAFAEDMVLSDRAFQALLQEGVSTATLPFDLDAYLVTRLWDFNLQGETWPDLDTLMEAYEARAAEFPTDDWVEGARILIEPGPEQTTVAEAIQQRLDAGEPFAEVAREFYASVGQDYDGAFARIERGRMAPDLFEAFFAQDPGGAYFGPVERDAGLVFGRLADKGSSGTLPLRVVEKRLAREIGHEAYQKARREFFDSRRAHHDIAVLYDGQGPAPAGGDPVLRFDGETYSYDEVIAMNTGLFGDRADPRFAGRMIDLAQEQLLILSSDAAPAIRDSPEYRFLSQGLLAQATLHQHLVARHEANPPTREELRAYYEANGDLYRDPDEVKLIAVHAQHLQDPAATPREQHVQRRLAWRTIGEIRDHWAARENPANAGEALAEYATVPGVTVQRLLDWSPADAAGLAVALDLPNAKLGEISDSLIGRDRYTVYLLLDHRPGELPPFEEWEDALASDFARQRLTEWRKELLEPYREEETQSGYEIEVMGIE